MSHGRAIGLARTALLSALAISLAGCLNIEKQIASVEEQISSVLSGPSLSPEVDAPVSTLVGGNWTGAKLDASDQRLIRAVEARLRGADGTRVQNDLAVATPADLPDFGPTLSGLKLMEVVLTPEAAPTPAPGDESLAALLRFGDAVGRSLDITLASLYREAANQVTVKDLTIGQIVVSDPRVELFALPSARIDQGLVQSAENYGALYRAVEAKSIDMTDLAAAPDGRQEYAFIAFVKAPLDKGASLQMSIGQGKKLANGDASGSAFRDFGGGWVVGLLRSELDLRNGPARWIAVVHDPAGEERKAGIIGFYSTKPAPSAGQSSQTEGRGETRS